MVGALPVPADLGGLGRGRLLPPQVLRVGVDDSVLPAVAGDADDAARVPYQRGVDGQADARVVAPRGAPAEERDDAGPPSSWRSSGVWSTGRGRRVSCGRT